MSSTIHTMETEKPEFAKYPRIPYVDESPDLFGREAYVFEKIDGSLSQVRRTETGILGGSKANYITGATKRPMWAPEFLEWMHSNHSLYNLRQGLIMFGEWLEPVTIDYDSDCLHKFYFIDLANVNPDGQLSFFDYDEAVDYLSEWDIKGVEILPPIQKTFIDQQKVKEIVDYHRSALRTADERLEQQLLKATHDSNDDIFSRNKKDIRAEEVKAEIEGVVLKNYSLQKFAKYLHPRYSEIREQEKTLEGRYVNDIRVMKAKRRLKDNGNHYFSLDQLVDEVIADIKNESSVSVNPTAIKALIRIHDLF